MSTAEKRDRGFPGHYPVRNGPGDWRCKCGTRLSGGPYGTGQRGARDVMKFHRLDLRMAELVALGLVG